MPHEVTSVWRLCVAVLAVHLDTWQLCFLKKALTHPRKNKIKFKETLCIYEFSGYLVDSKHCLSLAESFPRGSSTRLLLSEGKITCRIVTLQSLSLPLIILQSSTKLSYTQMKVFGLTANIQCPGSWTAPKIALYFVGSH